MVQGEDQTGPQRRPLFHSGSDMEFLALETVNNKALNLGEFQLYFPMTPLGPTFFSQPIRKLPECFLPDRFFANYYEMLRPPITTLAVPQLRVILVGLFGGSPTKLDPNKIHKVFELRYSDDY